MGSDELTTDREGFLLFNFSFVLVLCLLLVFRKDKTSSFITFFQCYNDICRILLLRLKEDHYDIQIKSNSFYKSSVLYGERWDDLEVTEKKRGDVRNVLTLVR